MFHHENGSSLHHAQGTADILDQQLRHGLVRPSRTHARQLQRGRVVPRAVERPKRRICRGDSRAAFRRRDAVREGNGNTTGEEPIRTDSVQRTQGADARHELLEQLEEGDRRNQSRDNRFVSVLCDRVVSASACTRKPGSVLSPLPQVAQPERANAADEHSSHHDRN